jgi:hypothetical protein
MFADGMVVCHMPYGPTAYFGIFNTVLRHDIGQKKEVGTISEVYPHLIFDKFSSQLGQRLANILKHLFPVPKDDSKRVVTFANDNDYISFRHHTYTAPKGAKSIELKEVRSSCGGGKRRLWVTRGVVGRVWGGSRGSCSTRAQAKALKSGRNTVAGGGGRVWSNTCNCVWGGRGVLAQWCVGVRCADGGACARHMLHRTVALAVFT